MSSLAWLLLLGPVVAIGTMSVLLQTALSPSQIRWQRILLSLVILGLTCIWVAYLAGTDVAGGIVVLLSLLITVVIVLGISVWMAISLSGWRKLAALGIAIGVPAILFFAWDRGATYSPEETTTRNGNRIVAALATYHQRTGVYPATLAELVPTAFDSLPTALTTQGTGWLYATANGEFILGYWRWPEKMGPDVCLYHSQSAAWNCAFNDWGPFQAVPTPSP